MSCGYSDQKNEVKVAEMQGVWDDFEIHRDETKCRAATSLY